MVFDSKTGLTAPVRRILWAQIVLIGVLTVALLLTTSWLTAYSLLIGGAICVLTNIIIAYGIFPSFGKRGAVRIAKRFFIAEGLKYLITILAMAAVFKWLTINPLSFFAGYILALAVFWLAPVLTKTNTAKATTSGAAL